MANEDKIIEMLTNIQSDIATMKADIDTLKNGKKNNIVITEDDNAETKEERIKKQLDALDKLVNLLNDEEKEAFGKFMDAEEERKAAIYG
ncbi:MAG: hypothetical protein IJ563_06510 [Selenomonadaceae bacterium]|nr:hypothetical protein [Selenomonadaceae bacterium]